MKIAIIGTVGVPARYGGFETLAEQLAKGIKPEAHKLVIYCQRSAYPELNRGEQFEGHQRVLLPLRANGPASMVHDMLAMTHAAFIAKVDALLVLGYSGAWFLPMVRLMRPRMQVVTNIDGMEWRRDKFGRAARALLRGLEWFATRFSTEVIADNVALVDLARNLHQIEPRLIAYGGDHTLVAPKAFVKYEPGYFLSIARIEPENNCHLILDACEAAEVRLIFIGNWDANGYGRALKLRFSNSRFLTLLDPVYDLQILAAVREHSIGYIHGHSVGGTNPSLVEALFHTDKLLSYDCVFNKSTLSGVGSYFKNSDDLFNLLRYRNSGLIEKNELAELREKYKWTHVISSYLKIFESDADLNTPGMAA